MFEKPSETHAIIGKKGQKSQHVIMNYRKLLSFKGMSSPDNKNPTALGEFNVPINVQEKAPKKCFKPKTTTEKVSDIH